MSQRANFGWSTHGANTEFVRTYPPYILHPHSVRTYLPVTKKNPTSPCAQLDPFQAHKSTLAGRISYFNGIWVYLHSWGCAYQDTCVLGEGHPLQGVYLHSWGCAYQDTCVLGEGHPLQGVYLHSWGCAYQDACVLGRGIHYRGCTFIAGGVHTRTHVYWGRGIHYRGCTFIAGGVHARMHVYWGGASTTGGVPS